MTGSNSEIIKIVSSKWEQEQERYFILNVCFHESLVAKYNKFKKKKNNKK